VTFYIPFCSRLLPRRLSWWATGFVALRNYLTALRRFLKSGK
jgi:hypothetical protein